MAPEESEKQARAATDIQRHYRGHRERRQLKGFSLSPSQRWDAALSDAQYRTITQPISREERLGSISNETNHSLASSPPRAMWRKAADIAKKAQYDDVNSSSSEDSGSEPGEDEEQHRARQDALRSKRLQERRDRVAYSKTMDMQYFLEMVDLKHRYGSNLRAYHEHWQRQDTHENFFYWLDYGEGKDVDLSVCSREQLDREMVRYLSREERQAYLVKIDKDGRLCWARNGERIDTTEKFTDSKQGIVPLGDPEAYSNETKHGHDHALIRRESKSSFSDSSSDSEASERADRYLNTKLDSDGCTKKSHHVSPSTILNQLLRKTVRKNTWIFVTDISSHLYVGIKQSGAFQHSSFLHGARVSAAGLIKIKDGKLKHLSPLSGHYRPAASQFRRFIHSLQEAGVDMSGVTVSKSYAVLVGLEAYGSLKKGKKKITDASKDVAHKVAPSRINGHNRNASNGGGGSSRADEPVGGERRSVNGNTGPSPITNDGNRRVEEDATKEVKHGGFITRLRRGMNIGS